MASLLLLNKPFHVLTQFTDDNDRKTLADFVDTRRYPGYYPAGRLDYDSEGLVALTNDGKLQHQLANPNHKQPKTYWVQVEGAPDPSAIEVLKRGLTLKDGPTKPCKARIIDEPPIWKRHPPIRERASIPTHWLEIILTEGRNRQVRRMTAAIGLPTLRLIRSAIGPWNIADLALGQSKELSVHLAAPKSGTRTRRNNTGTSRRNQLPSKRFKK